MKYIDADKLLALIDAKIQELGLSGSTWVGRSVLHDLRSDITSLQQEQPEVDLEKEIEDYYYGHLGFIIGPNDTKKIVESIALHFYELGKNAK